MPKKPGTNGTSKPKTQRAIPVGNRPPSSSSASHAPAELAPSKTLPASGPRSLMKTSQVGAGRSVQRRLGGPLKPGPTSVATPRSKAPNVISGSRQQKIEERIAAATEELSGGITEAASAAEELR